MPVACVCVQYYAVDPAMSKVALLNKVKSPPRSPLMLSLGIDGNFGKSINFHVLGLL